MSAVKLESFSHDVEIRKGISKFESFDSLRENAFNEGVKTGADAASRAFESEKLRTLAPILEALNDMAFSQVEASRALLVSMRPMLDKLIETVLPQCAGAGFSAEVAALVMRAYEKSPASQIVVLVAPESVVAIQDALAPAQADFIVRPDPALDELQAKVEWQSGYDQIDLAAALDSALDTVDAFFSNIERTGTHNA